VQRAELIFCYVIVIACSFPHARRLGYFEQGHKALPLSMQGRLIEIDFRRLLRQRSNDCFRGGAKTEQESAFTVLSRKDLHFSPFMP
jgi:hypothetical protein